MYDYRSELEEIASAIDSSTGPTYDYRDCFDDIANRLVDIEEVLTRIADILETQSE